MKTRTWIFEKRPVGIPKSECFRLTENQISKIENGEILLKTLYVSVDPYLRGRMSAAKSYTAGFNLGEPMRSGIIAEVLETKNQNFNKGDFVTGRLNWSDYQISHDKGIT